MRTPVGFKKKKERKMWNKIKIGFFALLFMSSIFILPVNADVNIDVSLFEGDASITVTQGNGDTSVIVDNVDIIEGWKDAQKEASAYLQMIYYLSARSDVDDLEDELDELEGDLVELINQLNQILPAMENRDVMTLRIIGVDHNSSDVVTSLRSMNVSIADYLQMHEYIIDEYHENFLQISEDLDVIGAQLEYLENSTTNNAKTISDLKTQMQTEVANICESLSELQDDTEGKFIVLSCLSAGAIMLLLVQVYIQGVEYMRLKAKVDELQGHEN